MFNASLTDLMNLTVAMNETRRAGLEVDLCQSCLHSNIIITIRLNGYPLIREDFDIYNCLGAIAWLQKQTNDFRSWQ